MPGLKARAHLHPEGQTQRSFGMKTAVIRATYPPASHDRPVRKADAWLASPLPNACIPPTAIAGMIHHLSLVPFDGSDLRGSAKLLRRGKDLQIWVRANHEVEVHLKSCRPIAPAGAGLLVLVLTKTGGPAPIGEVHTCFDLSQPSDGEKLAERDLRQLSAANLQALEPRSIDGLTISPNLARPTPTVAWGLAADPQHASPPAVAEVPTQADAVADRAYFDRRMREELDAALRADGPGLAARHVQMATIIARRLQSPAAAAAGRR